MGLTSILVTVGRDATVSKANVDQLDRQSLPPDCYEVIWAVPPAHAAHGYLAEVVSRRPNMRLVSTEMSDGLDACAGNYVLALSDRETLYPRAAELMTAYARAHDLHTVAGRVAEQGAPIPSQALVDADDVAPGDLNPALLLAVRRDRASLDARGLLVPSGRSGVLAAEPVARRERKGTHPLPILRSSHAHWEGDELAVQCAVPAHMSVVAAVAEHKFSAAQYLLGFTVGTASSAETGARLNLRINPRRAAAGRELDNGWWRLLVQLVDADGATTMYSVGRLDCCPALLGSRAYVPADLDGGFAIDVGPTDRPLIAVDDPELGDVTESVVGSRLVLSLPDIHTFDAVDQMGAVGFGPIRVPAKLTVDGAGARLETYATGVPGATPLSARFGPGPFLPTGLQLDVANAGSMRLVKVPPPAKKPAKPAKKAAKTAKNAQAGGRVPSGAANSGKQRAALRSSRRRPRRGALATIRRRVPARLEPVVRSAARHPLLRRLYRRFTH